MAVEQNHIRVNGMNVIKIIVGIGRVPLCVCHVFLQMGINILWKQKFEPFAVCVCNTMI